MHEGHEHKTLRLQVVKRQEFKNFRGENEHNENCEEQPSFWCASINQRVMMVEGDLCRNIMKKHHCHFHRKEKIEAQTEEIRPVFPE